MHSVTRWLSYYFNISPFRTMKFAQKYDIFAKVWSQFCQILNSYSRKGPKLLNIMPKWRKFAKIWSHWICSTVSRGPTCFIISVPDYCQPPAVKGICCTFAFTDCSQRVKEKTSYFTNKSYPKYDSEPFQCLLKIRDQFNKTDFAVTQPMWPEKKCQMSIKVAQKWFH